jgi:hypothetical protein
VTALVFFQVAVSGIAPTFRALPTAMLTGSATAGGIALINSATLEGFLAPYAKGLVQDATGSFMIGLLTIAMGSVAAGIIVLALGHERPARGPGAAAHGRSERKGTGRLNGLPPPGRSGRRIVWPVARHTPPLHHALSPKCDPSANGGTQDRPGISSRAMS